MESGELDAPGRSSKQLAAEILEYVKSRTAPYNYPPEIAFVTELPKTVSGRVKRSVLGSREVERKPGRPGSGAQGA